MRRVLRGRLRSYDGMGLEDMTIYEPKIGKRGVLDSRPG